MPKLHSETKLAAAQAEWAEFEAGWARSRSGNLWCRYEGMHIVIFYRSDSRRSGRYCWVINSEDYEPRFSVEDYETESDAISAVGHHLGVGEL